MATEQELLELDLQSTADNAGFVSAEEAAGQFEAATARLQQQTVGLNAAQRAQNETLATSVPFHVNYGNALTAEEERYARLQLSSQEYTKAERAAVSEYGNLARAASAYGAEGEAAISRLGAAFGSVASLGPVGIGAAAGLIGGGAAIEATKAAIDNSEAQQRADLSLAQAAAVTGQSYATLESKAQSFISTNRAFISNQFDAEAAMAQFVRAGNDEKTTTEAMNTALDLADMKHISLSDAATMVELAMMGNGRAVRSLGIDLKTLSETQDISENDTKKLQSAQDEAAKAATALSNAQRSLQEEEDSLHAKRTVSQLDLDHLKDKQDAVAKAQQNLAAANANVASIQQALGVSQSRSVAILDELNSKVAGSRNTTTDLEQAQNKLNNDWQQFTADVGPGVVTGLANITNAADQAYQKLHNLPAVHETNPRGQDKSAESFDAMSKAAEALAKWLEEDSNKHRDVAKDAAADAVATAQAAQEHQLATHTASEHADILDRVALTSEVAAHAASEHADAMKPVQDMLIKNRDESYNVVAANERVNAEIDQLNRNNELASHFWDEHNQSAKDADATLLATNQSIQDIRESIAHANQERLDIQVDKSALDGVRAEIQSIFNQQYVLHFASEHNPYDGQQAPGSDLGAFAGP